LAQDEDDLEFYGKLKKKDVDKGLTARQTRG
jgi:hypothetical protein